jgi:hypothetical protein
MSGTATIDSRLGWNKRAGDPSCSGLHKRHKAFLAIIFGLGLEVLCDSADRVAKNLDRPSGSHSVEHFQELSFQVKNFLPPRLGHICYTRCATFS